MCLAGQVPAAPSTAADAVAMVAAGLGWLAKADVASLTTIEQADCLRGLERASSMHTAARSRVLSAFSAQGGYEDDGQGSARTWLRWQTRITGGAAYGALGWMHRLAGHRAVGDALGAGQISESWARQICDWTGKLPAGVRGDADVFLLGAAAGGAELRDLGKMAEEIRRQCARPDTDGGDGFAGRSLRLDTTFEGAGKLDGNLTPQCAAAVQAVLDALGKRRGPEDERTKGQRLHDALEDACRRLIGSGCLPERAGQPTQIVLHMDLDRLRGLPGAPEAEAAWAGQATAGPVMTATRRSSRWSPAASTPACWTASPQPCCTAPRPGQLRTARPDPARTAPLRPPLSVPPQQTGPASTASPRACPGPAASPAPRASTAAPVPHGRPGQSGPPAG
jgi:hypothetical protein